MSRSNAHLHKSGVSAEKCVYFPISLNALGPIDGRECCGNLLKPLARGAVEPEVSANHERPVRSIANRRPELDGTLCAAPKDSKRSPS